VRQPSASNYGPCAVLMPSNKYPPRPYSLPRVDVLTMRGEEKGSGAPDEVGIVRMVLLEL
jgi:hypothetical protein